MDNQQGPIAWHMKFYWILVVSSFFPLPRREVFWVKKWVRKNITRSFYQLFTFHNKPSEKTYIKNVCFCFNFFFLLLWLWMPHFHKINEKNKKESLESFQLFLVAQTVKNLPARQEIWVWSLGWKNPLEKRMAIHSSYIAWRIPWTEEPDGPQFMGSQRHRHD